MVEVGSFRVVSGVFFFGVFSLSFTPWPDLLYVGTETCRKKPARLES